MLFVLFTVLTALQGFSQSDTNKNKDSLDTRPVTLPFWVAKEIALDLEEKDRLERIVTVQVSEISNLKGQISTYDLVLTGKNASIELKDRFISILEVQLESERAKKVSKYGFNDLLIDLGKVALGMLIGGLLVVGI